MESCLALHVNRNPNCEETKHKQTNKPLNLGPEPEASSMFFVMAGISWLAQKHKKQRQENQRSHSIALG